MGGAPRGKDPLLAAQRELREETGLLDEPCAGMNLEETEDIEVRTLPLSEAIEMARDGRITDALSAAALFRIALDNSGN